jgi:prefoldin beta subunit
MSLAIKLQTASSDFQKLQNDMTKAVEARQKLDAQLSENELVKKVTHDAQFTLTTWF